MGEVEEEMKKTVIFEFQDDFQFPEFFEDMGKARCLKCPLYCRDDEGDEWCFLQGYEDRAPCMKCPFYGGADTVNYDEY